MNISVVMDGKAYVLDLAAKLDATADFVCKQKWGEFEFPPAFGRDALPEVKYILAFFSPTLSGKGAYIFFFALLTRVLIKCVACLGSVHCRPRCEKWRLFETHHPE